MGFQKKVQQSSGVVAQLVEVSCFTAQRGATTEKRKMQSSGVVAQLVEHLLCKQGVVSSSLISSTRIKRSRKGKNEKERHLLGQPSPSRQFEPDQLHQDKHKRGMRYPISKKIQIRQRG